MLAGALSRARVGGGRHSTSGALIPRMQPRPFSWTSHPALGGLPSPRVSSRARPVPSGPSRSHRGPSRRYEAELSPVEQKLSALRTPLAQRPFFETPSALGATDLYEDEDEEEEEGSDDDMQPS